MSMIWKPSLVSDLISLDIGTVEMASDWLIGNLDKLINNYSSRPHEGERREGERNNCFSKIQLVGQKNIETKHISLV